MKTYTWNDAGATRQWHDGKRYWWLCGLLVPLFPVFAAMLALHAGQRWGWWLGPIWIALVVPGLDWLLGTDETNPPPAVQEPLDQDRFYRWSTFAFVPLQWFSLAFACHVIGAHPDMPWTDWLGLALTVGTVGGVAINAGHELGHKKPTFERWLGRAALAQTGYGHFYVEHNRGHHYRVATPEDPASARMGESFWRFLPRTLLGSLQSAWRLEAERLHRRGLGPWHWQNHVLQAWSLTPPLWGALMACFGGSVAAMLVVQAAVGIGLLEVVNYLEHYGLLRAQRADGRYEKCQPEHSWNANQIASNLLLYNLERHSDHHAWPARRFQTLRHFESAPQLPTGYAGMLMLALVPPLWFAVMDPRVARHYRGDLTRANVHPARRQALQAKWGAQAQAPAASLGGVAG